MANAVLLENIAGVVILYNSPITVIDNINTYISQVDKLYVVDNSTTVNIELVSSLKSQAKIIYHSMNGNKGIAAALNWAANKAVVDKFSILLTMDDDTRTPHNMVQQMLEFWNNWPERIGILSGVHHNKPSLTTYNEVLFTLTSGNLLNLDAFRLIGNFREDFFIDHVDHDYGFRLNENNYAVIELPNIHLDHKLGYSQNFKIGPLKIRTYGTTAPIRLYYYARNGIYLSRKHFKSHPEFAWSFIKEMIRRWIKTLLLDEGRNQRIRMLYNGIKDGLIGKLGVYSPAE